MIKFNMKIVMLYFLLFGLNCCQAEIKMIQATMRHAHRNPGDSTYLYYYYPNDPHKNHNWSPEGAFGLTKRGKRNAYNYGLFLKRQYSTLVDSISDSNEIYFHAINMSRTIDTALYVATGFLSLGLQQPWHPDLPVTSIPIHVTPIADDFLNFPLLFCENYNIDKVQADADSNRLFDALTGVQDTFQYLSHHTGVKHTHSRQGLLLYHQLYSEADVGLTLEPWTNRVFPNGMLSDISAVDYILQTWTERMKRLFGGVWIKKFLDHVNELSLNQTNTKMKGFFYVCMEMQIAAILNTLGIYRPHVPHYLSTVVFELHEINGIQYVKVVYNTGLTPQELVIPGCEKPLCLLSTFKSVLDNVILKNFEEDCGKRGIFPIIGSHLRK